MTTIDERIKASNEAYELCASVELAHRILYRVWEEYFSDKEQKALNVSEAAEIGDILNMVTDRLITAVQDFHLQTGQGEYRENTQYRLDKAKRYLVYAEVNKLHNKVCDLNRSKHCPPNLTERRLAACKLPDDEAIAAFTALLKEAEGKPTKGETA